MYIPGTSDNEKLIGTDGNDHLDGGAGEDTLQGGLGDDYYIVNSIGDQVIELANQGVDTVVASVDYTLSDNVENLFVTGNATVGTGNSADNYIVANQSLASTLYGLDGNDVIIGGAGDDTLYGDAGNDYLNGGAGADSLVGGTGDDYYVVDNIGDQVVEASGGGFDSVVSLANYTLSDNVENLFLGGEATAGTGNNGDNYMVANQSLATTLDGLDGNDVIIGGAGKDTLNGDAGNDYLNGGAGYDLFKGGLGNDYYVVSANPFYDINQFYDQVVEQPGEGVDSVVLTEQLGFYFLPENVENLFLTGTSHNGIGNSSDNYMVADQTRVDYHIWGWGSLLDGMEGNDLIIGSNNSDQLLGGLGNDTLTGGTGYDRFTFYSYSSDSASAFASMGVDTITDFTSGLDKMDLNTTNGTFSGLTASNLTFASVTSELAAAISEANIVYNSNNGSLFYNQDGVTEGFGTGGQFATLAPNLTTLGVSDFFVSSPFEGA